MKQAIKRELKPKLRFPEFRDAGEWDEKRLDEMFDFHSTANNSRADLSNAGNIFYIHYGDIHTKFHQYIDFSKDAIPKIPSSLYKNATFLKNGDLVIADASEDTEGIAKAVEVRGIEHGVKAISGLHTILLRDSRQNYINGFKGLLREIAEVKKQIKRLAVGVKVYSVSKTVLKQVLLPLPSHPEQQKIADCLLSIDELITAQTQKLNTLKTHKKGLMQQLFPAEGETLPKLRFPEFLDSGEWETKQLGELLLGHPDYGVNAAAVTYSEDLPAYLRITDISEEGYFLCGKKASVAIKATDEHYMSEGDIVLARTGASVGKSYKFRKEDGKLVFAGFLIRIKPDPTKIDSTFLFNFLFTEQYWNWVRVTSARSGQPGINGNEYAALLIPVPPHVRESGGLSEQLKIAECLSSIDELITTQTQKLDTLKTHKKGLMQQLFPALDEVQRWA